MGKTPIDVKDTPGFVTNRILIPMINEAVFALNEGVASAEDIDAVMRMGASHPMGPLELADLIGLLERTHVRPVIDRVLPLDRAAEAFAALDSGEVLGKIVLTP